VPTKTAYGAANSKPAAEPVQWNQARLLGISARSPLKGIGNTMFEVTVEAGFSSGHYLRNYRGKCENPHGHNYKVFVTLIGEELDEAGLLLDFKLLKQVMRPVVDYLDHQMINDLEPFTTVNPSAENLARYFYQETAKQLREMTSGRVRVKDCTLYETDTSFARFYE
jgi:6-pyruvoyltetrahydropterin/6-carboxytetrahydropterin synthase